MSDLYVDKFLNNKHCYKIKAEYSRIFCDVEKFKDESKEVMAKIGMGPIYTKTSKGENLLSLDDDYREMVLKKYYDAHHNKMDNLVNKILNKNKKCYIIDLHSFSEHQVKETLNIKDCPDICIGVDDNFKDSKLNDLVVTFLTNHGYNVKINYPYSGSFVPNIAYENKNKNVKTIMIEVNRKLYMNYDYSIKEKEFDRLKETTDFLLEEIIKYVNKQ